MRVTYCSCSRESDVLDCCVRFLSVRVPSLSYEDIPIYSIFHVGHDRFNGSSRSFLYRTCQYDSLVSILQELTILTTLSSYLYMMREGISKFVTIAVDTSSSLLLPSTIEQKDSVLLGTSD